MILKGFSAFASICLVVATCAGSYAAHLRGRMADPDWQQVAKALGKTGSLQPGGVYKVAFPRTDLRVTANGIKIDPALALGSWVAFKAMGNECMVMGDLVLTEPEVGAVMLKLEQGGIEITALHNHILDETPRIMYMHIGGIGQPQKLAAEIREALSLSKTPFGTDPRKTLASDLDVKKLDTILGRQGKLNGWVIQYSIPRSEKVMEHGIDIPASMGVATSINFEPTGMGNAAITGDFVMTAGEVNNVVRALRENGIAVTALHSHMLDEEPRLFFLHFWANDDAAKLAVGLRAALDKTNSAR